MPSSRDRKLNFVFLLYNTTMVKEYTISTWLVDNDYDFRLGEMYFANGIGKPGHRLFFFNKVKTTDEQLTALTLRWGHELRLQ